MFDRLVDVLLQFIGLFRFFVVVDAWQQGVRLRLGKPSPAVGPGLHWLVPFGVDRMVRWGVVPDVHKLEAQTVTLADGHTVVVEPIVTFQVSDLVKFLCEVEDAETAICDTVAAVVRRRLSGAGWETLLDSERSERLEGAITTESRRLAKKWGIEILTVAFASLARARTIRLIGGRNPS